MAIAVSAGCNSQAARRSESHSTGATAKIVDRLNREVTIAQVPRRLVSLSPATTELIFSLESGDLIVGATNYCDYPDAAKTIPRVGSGPMGTISLEAIIGLRPDLVLCKFDTHQPLVEALDRLNIPCIALGPESLEELFEEAGWLGELLGCQDHSQRLVEAMRGRLAKLQEIVNQRWLNNDGLTRHHPRVFYQVWEDPLMTVGHGSFIDQLLELAGFENIVDGSLGRYPRISPELIVERDPEYIFVPSSPTQTIDLDKIFNRSGWQNVTAIRSRQVFVVNGDAISRCGPRMLDALEQIIHATDEPQP